MSLKPVPEVIVENEETQMTFEGMEVKGSRFSLRSASELYTNELLSPETHVKFNGSGVVKGIRLYRTADGWRRVHEIEVIDAYIEKP